MTNQPPSPGSPTRRAALLAGAALAATAPAAGVRAQAPGGGAARPAPIPALPAAQTAPPAGVVLPAATPCANAPGDIAGLLLEGLGGAGEQVVTFGQAFRPGDLPRGARLAARLPDGRPLRVQADVQARHPDGSARHAVISLLAPALTDGAQAGVVLSRGGAVADGAAALDVAARLAGREALVEVTPDGGSGLAARFDLLALWRDALAARGGAAAASAWARPWRSGPLAVEGRVVAALPPTANGLSVTSARIVADLALLADGTLWVELWVRNDIAFTTRPGDCNCALRFVLDGREALRTGPIRQFHYQCWGRLLGSAGGGRAAPARHLVRHDVAYLTETAALPRYDLSVGVSEEALGRMAQQSTDPNWGAPLHPRGFSTNMGMAGGRPDIGITTAWQAMWLHSGDRRAARFCVEQAEAGGAVPWHCWDPQGGADGRGGWVDMQRHPLLWSDGRGRPSLPRAISTESGWNPVNSHQPSFSYIPYLLTGRRAFLDNLEAQAAWCVHYSWSAVRQAQQNREGFLVVQRQQVRAAAWNMREIGHAAWIGPDASPHRAYFQTVERANWAWIRAMLPQWTQFQGEAHGWLPPYALGPGGGASAWQQDFFCSAAAWAARRGVADARAFLEWAQNFLVGRFNAEARGFPANDGANNVIAFAREQGNDLARLLRTWREVGEQTLASNWSNGQGWQHSQANYGALGLQSLAQVADVLDSEEARRTYFKMLARLPPFTDPATFARDGTNNIVPRGFHRVPSRLRACTAARPAVAAPT